MTLVDAMALVLGVALAFAATPGRTFFLQVPAVWVLAFFGLIQITEGFALALSIVILGRLVRFRRIPRPAEWLAILVAGSMLAGRPEWNVDGYVNWLYARFPTTRDSKIDFGGWRWVIAGGELAILLTGLGALRLARRRLSAWSKSLALFGLSILAISGPLAVCGLQGADLLTPSEGFGPGVGPILLRKACWLAAQIPVGLLFGIPAFETLAERIGGRRWSWTDWAGASLSLTMGLISLILDRNEFPIPSWGWLTEVAMVLAWLDPRPASESDDPHPARADLATVDRRGGAGTRMSRAEPRSMTLVNAMALVAGSAGAFALVSRWPMPYLVMGGPVTARVFWGCELERAGHGLALAASAVVLARVMAYRRLPRAAEWLGVFAGLWPFREWPEYLIAPYLYSGWMVKRFSWVTLGWIKGAIYLAVAAIGLAAIRAGRDILPAWLKAVGLAGVGLLALAGPLWEFEYRVVDLLAPASLYGPDRDAALYLHREACMRLGELPRAVFYGTLAMAALCGRQAGRKLTWIEWAAATSAAVAILGRSLLIKGWVLDLSSGYFAGNWPTWMRAAERGLVGVWAISIIAISRCLSINFVSGWERMVEPTNQVLDSPASIR